MTFKQHLILQNDLIETEIKIGTLLYLANAPQNMNESDLNESVKDWLKKMGLSLVKGPSFIDYINDFVSGVGTIVLAAIQGDKAKIKAQMDRFKVEDLIDFLSTLNDITLGVMSGPLKFIQVVTGWDLKASIKASIKSATTAVKTIKKALNTIRTNVEKIVTGPDQDKLMLSIQNLDDNIPNL